MARQPDPTTHPDFWVGDSIADILAEAGISLGRHRPRAGGDIKLLCPRCNGGTSREPSLSLKIDADGRGAAWNCHRGKCPGFKGNGRIEEHRLRRDQQDEAPPRRERPAPVPPKLDSPEQQQRPDSLYAWFERRGISRETVDAFGIYGRLHRFPPSKGEEEWTEKTAIVFPYRWRGEVVNRKFRSPDKVFVQDKGALRSLFNIDAWESDDVGILVEGEMDVLALWEAGYRQVASLPDGSPQTLLAEDDPKRSDDKRFDALETCGEVLARMQRIIIATDADVTGGYLAEEFARRLGRVRCAKVEWPDGCKDANDVLLKHGAERLRECVEAARPWPLEGVVEVQPGQLSAFLRAGRTPSGLPCGIGALDEALRFPAGPGWLVVVTGRPGAGKTSVIRPWLAWLAQRHDLGIVWCSPEDNRAEVSALELARIIAGQPLQEAGTYIPEDVLAQAERWIGERVTFVQSDNPDQEMTLEWVLARAEEAKRRRQRHMLVLDPWNEFEHQFGRTETETQYTGRWLRRLKAWGRAEGMSVVIVAHPKVMQRDQKTRKYQVADGYDISGGANWANKADLGVTIERAEDGIVEAHCWKARFRAFGTRGAVARMKLDPRTGRLSSIGMQMDDGQGGLPEEEVA